MKKNRFPFLTFWLLIFMAGIALSKPAPVIAQQPTPTAGNNTTPGMFITVISTEPHINVRMGPGSIAYPIVGQLPTGATAPALGRSPGGDWIQIALPEAPNGKGWVYSPLVQVSPGFLQIIEPPPTPIPPATPTIDPTLLAQFSTSIPAVTLMPSFTPPPALTVPVYTEAPSSKRNIKFPMAPLIIVLGVVGSLGFLVSLLRGRN